MAENRIVSRPAAGRPRSKVAEIEERVRKALAEKQTVARDVEREYEEKLTLGEKVSDAVAAFGGSWTFIFFFGGVMAVWMVLNSAVLARGAFDPFPYILLNLVLSTLAALQAPVIMMSQNRQAAKDRARAEHEYEINLKAELEIGQIHRKLEDLCDTRWAELVATQRRQIEHLERLIAGSER